MADPVLFRYADFYDYYVSNRDNAALFRKSADVVAFVYTVKKTEYTDFVTPNMNVIRQYVGDFPAYPRGVYLITETAQNPTKRLFWLTPEPLLDVYKSVATNRIETSGAVIVGNHFTFLLEKEGRNPVKFHKTTYYINVDNKGARTQTNGFFKDPVYIPRKGTQTKLFDVLPDHKEFLLNLVRRPFIDEAGARATSAVAAPPELFLAATVRVTPPAREALIRACREIFGEALNEIRAFGIRQPNGKWRFTVFYDVRDWPAEDLEAPAHSFEADHAGRVAFERKLTAGLLRSSPIT